jgi:protein-S-isoprenylcysteine O-methyltransferase Ste14
VDARPGPPHRQPTTAGRRAFVWAGGALFVVALAVSAVWYLGPFGVDRAFSGSALWYDAALFGIFALHHSLFAHAPAKRAVARVVPNELMRSTYVWAASALLIIVCVAWRPVGGELFRDTGPAAAAHAAVQLAGIWLIAQSVRGLDPLELAGIRRETRPTKLQITGPYRIVRHPLYLGWMLAVFGAAHMTGDRFAFAAISSIYLVAAIPYEEASLVQTFGGEYGSYRRQVRWRVIPYVY